MAPKMNGTTRIERAEKACLKTHRIPERVASTEREGVAAGVAAVLAPYLMALGFLGEPRPSAAATTLIAIQGFPSCKFRSPKSRPELVKPCLSAGMTAVRDFFYWPCGNSFYDPLARIYASRHSRSRHRQQRGVSINPRAWCPRGISSL